MKSESGFSLAIASQPFQFCGQSCFKEKVLESFIGLGHVGRYEARICSPLRHLAGHQRKAFRPGGLQMIWCWLSKEQKWITRALLWFPSLLIPAANYNFKNRGPHTPDVRSRYEIVGKCICLISIHFGDMSLSWARPTVSDPQRRWYRAKVFQLLR